MPLNRVADLMRELACGNLGRIDRVKEQLSGRNVLINAQAECARASQQGPDSLIEQEDGGLLPPLERGAHTTHRSGGLAYTGRASKQQVAAGCKASPEQAVEFGVAGTDR